MTIDNDRNGGASAPFAFDARAAPAFWMVETLWSVLASGIQTDNRIGFMEQVMGCGLGPPTHRHPHASEGFYILEGRCTFNVLGQSVEAGPGTLLHLPRLLPHSFAVNSDEARVLNFYTPACFEVMIMACGRLAPERRRPTMPESSRPESAEQIEMLSRLYGQEAVTALPFLQPSTPDLMRTSSDGWGIADPVITTAAEAELRHAYGAEWRCLIDVAQTGDTHRISEVTGPAGVVIPAPMGADSRALFVLDGNVDVSTEAARKTLTSGAFAYRGAGQDFSLSFSGHSRLLIIDLMAPHFR